MKLKLLAAMLACSFYGLPANAADTVKIGSLFSTTGSASFLGEPEYRTLKMYVDRINAEGGILGKPIELIHYDDGSDANKANNLTRRLLYDDEVDVIIGGTTTGATMSMYPLVEKAETPFFSMAGAVVIIDPVKKWMFKVSYTDRMVAEKIFQEMQQHGISKIGLLSETTGLGQSGKKESERAAPKYGIDIIASEVYNPKDTDMTPQLTKIKNTPGVEAVLVFGMGQGPVVATRNYRQLGIEQPLYQTHGVCAEEYIKLSGAAANGVKLPCAAILVSDKLDDSDPQKPVLTDYVKAYTETWNTDVSTFGGHTYDVLMLYKDAVERAGTTDTHKVLEQIESTQDFVGTAGIINLSPSDHLGLGLDALRMLEIKDGHWTLAD